MNIEDTIRAWKDPEFRKASSLKAEHPAGPTEINDEVLRDYGGGATLACNGTGACLTQHPKICEDAPTVFFVALAVLTLVPMGLIVAPAKYVMPSELS